MTDNLLYFERASDVDALSSFFCGERGIDILIHKKEGGLASFIAEQSCKMYIIYYQNEAVAVVVYSNSSIIVYDDEIPSVEIDFIAVRKDYRKKGIGRIILNTIEKHARQNMFPFMTVDAYYNKRYSAEGFYLKCGFERNAIVGEQKEIIPMLKQLM